MEIRKDNWVLVWNASNDPVELNDVVNCFRNDYWIVKGGNPPHKPSSSGKLWVVAYDDHDCNREFYPSVCDMKWIEED